MYKPLKRPTTTGKRYKRRKIVRDWLHYAVWYVRLAKIRQKPVSVFDKMALVIKVGNVAINLQTSSNEDCLKSDIDGYTFQQLANGSVRHLIEEAYLSQICYDSGKHTTTNSFKSNFIVKEA